MPKDTQRGGSRGRGRGRGRGLDLNYCEFDLSKVVDTKGGFFIEEEEVVVEGGVALEMPRAQKVAMYDTTKALDEDLNCAHCPSIDLDWKLHQHYNVLVCRKCRNDRPDQYSLLTKTECKQDYLLTDEELMDKTQMPHQLKKNPHKSSYSNMLLYLRLQVEAFVWGKWGSPDALDEEFKKRDAASALRKEKALKRKAVELRKKTRTSLWNATQIEHQGATSVFVASGDHKHQYGEAEEIGDGSGMMQETCSICGIKQVFEDFGF